MKGGSFLQTKTIWNLTSDPCLRLKLGLQQLSDPHNFVFVWDNVLYLIMFILYNKKKDVGSLTIRSWDWWLCGMDNLCSLSQLWSADYISVVYLQLFPLVLYSVLRYFYERILYVWCNWANLTLATPFHDHLCALSFRNQLSIDWCLFWARIGVMFSYHPCENPFNCEKDCPSLLGCGKQIIILPIIPWEVHFVVEQ